MTSLREQLRRLELDRVRELLPQPVRVLELGGGNGFQASLLHEWQHEVTSVDVAIPAQALHFPVQPFDGRNLPFPSASFDVVFSSNVLEHVEDLSGLLAEAARVLRPTGMMIHVLPSSTWRFWTSISHYAWVVSSVCLRQPNPDAPSPNPKRPYSATNLIRFLGRLAIPRAHGVHANAVAELYAFSAARWRRVFRRSGLQVESVAPTGIFYTGYKVLRNRLDLPARRRLAGVLGSSCNVFVLRVPAA